MPAKLTTEIFIARSKAIHGESAYDYSRCTYIRATDKVELGCNIHKGYWFFVRPADHTHSRVRCTKCAGTYIPTTEEFIDRSKLIHGSDHYDYSKCVYKNSNSKVKLGCNIHKGYWFSIKPNDHTSGDLTGCTKCSGIHTISNDEFIAESESIHGADHYDYSKCRYKNRKDKIELGCNIHKGYWFKISPKNHIHRKQGCAKCTNRYVPTTEEFIERAKLIHGESAYDYSKCVYKNNTTKVEIGCNAHEGYWFRVRPQSHINQSHGCPKCARRSFSKKQIVYLEYIAELEGIEIQHSENAGEYRIPSTRLRADGYCKSTNTVYEFHGDYWHGNPQVYNPTDINPSNYKPFSYVYNKTLERDQKIRDLGYNLVVMWEHEWDKIEKENKKLLKLQTAV